jgi:O-acetyl-ADP-ribose deacetylase (regulator of RNase III)
MSSRLSITRGDITGQAVDAIVNAANNSLLGGGGVDGAIHRAAGSKLLDECRTLGGCKTGDAKITGGYKLSAKHVIHTVGPVWQDGTHGEDEMLANCYRSCFSIAHKHNLKTIAFPSISTGVYRFPVERAARIALKEIHHELASNAAIDEITIVCFDKQTYETYLTVEREMKK